MWRAKWLLVVVASGLPVLNCISTTGMYAVDPAPGALVGPRRSRTYRPGRTEGGGLAVGLEDGAKSWDVPAAVGTETWDRPTTLAPVASARVARKLASAGTATRGINSGWRMGGFYVKGQTVDAMRKEKMLDNTFLSAWGYQFQWEYGEAGGWVGLVDVAPLIMGMDESLLIPSVSVLVGLRLPKTLTRLGEGSIEFGLGPHWSPRLAEMNPFPNDDVHIEGLGLAGSVGYAWSTDSGVNASINYSFMKSGDLTAHGIMFGWNFGL